MNKQRFSFKSQVCAAALVLIGGSAMLFNACQTNPTEIINPTVTDEGLRAFPVGSANQVLQGVRNQFSAMIANVALYNAYVS
ncbi:MAG: hypothetical protein RMI34_04880 [Chloroherpetonaceae bacterium]|nr:hypothetical protein [Chloroherpetonaceae bacterium]